MAIYKQLKNSTETAGFQPNRFEVPVPSEAAESREGLSTAAQEEAGEKHDAATAMEEGQIRRVIEQAVEEVRPQAGSGEIKTLSQADLKHVIENVELKIGKNLDGMSPHQLLETLINLPRNNN